MTLPENQMKLSKVQNEVVARLRKGAVIGELSAKKNGLYELFVRKPDWIPPKRRSVFCLQHPFEIRRLNKNTVFALLGEGLIREDNKIAETMAPFSRDRWYGFIS